MLQRRVTTLAFTFAVVFIAAVGVSSYRSLSELLDALEAVTRTMDLVTAHGGSVAVHSPGEQGGATFVVTLPVVHT